MLLPGMTVTTTPDSYAPFHQLRLARFEGKSWVLFGDVISAPARSPRAEPMSPATACGETGGKPEETLYAGGADEDGRRKLDRFVVNSSPAPG